MIIIISVCSLESVQEQLTPSFSPNNVRKVAKIALPGQSFCEVTIWMSRFKSMPISISKSPASSNFYQIFVSYLQDPSEWEARRNRSQIRVDRIGNRAGCEWSDIFMHILDPYYPQDVFYDFPQNFEQLFVVNLTYPWVNLLNLKLFRDD